MKELIKKTFKIIGITIIVGLASFGLVLLVGFLAVRYGWSDVSGNIDKNSSQYDIVNQQAKRFYPKLNLSELDKQINELSAKKKQIQRSLCQINLVRRAFPANAKRLIEAYDYSESTLILDRMMLAIDLRLHNPVFSEQLVDCDKDDNDLSADDVLRLDNLATSTNVFIWVDSREWQSIQQAIIKDRSVIEAASATAGVEPRILVSALIVEQLRLYHTQREMFEHIFKPLSILANANKMAWGVMAIKEKTAIGIEDNLRDPKSPFYLGEKYEHLLAFQTADPARERYDRLTNAKDHYYSYLYGALYLKELMTQWQHAGFPIDNRPEILATLFNIGLQHSQPKPNPEVGGSKIKIGEEEYSFGSLAYEFYFSGEMIEEFEYTD